MARIQTNKTNNVAEDLLADTADYEIVTIFVDITNNTVANEADSVRRGSLLYVNGYCAVTSRGYELAVHDNVTEWKEVNGIRDEYLKGTTIKLEDYVPMKYTYDGSAWGTA